MRSPTGPPELPAATVAGFLGGIIASWVMDQYQAVESRPVNVRRAEELLAEFGLYEPESAHQGDMEEAGDTRVKVAEMVSRKLFEHELTAEQKNIAGPAVHYGFGAVVGALYGGLSELVPMVSIGMGIPYATLVWLGGDEIAAPALGLAKAPTRMPAESHASELATHFVYGITLDVSRRILRRIL